MKGGTQVEMPHHAKVVVSDIRNRMMVRLRVSGSANRSAKVKRVRCCSSSASDAPLFFRAWAALRFSLVSTHGFDSSTPVRSQKANSAGMMPMKNMMRQAFGPWLPTNSQTKEARKKPMPSPHCISPAPRPRAWFGQASAVMEAPVAHSEPMAMPTSRRSSANDSQFQAKAESPVVSE